MHGSPAAAGNRYPEVPSDKDRARRPLYSAGTGSCGFVQQGIFTETADGELVKYDARSLGSAASLARLRGTVLSSRSLWLHVAFYVSVAATTCAVVGLVASQPDLIDAARVSEGVDYFSLFVAIALAFHVAMAVERWWELRCSLLGELWRATNDLSMVLAVHFPSREHRRLKTLVLRYCLLSFELMFMQARGELNLSELCQRQLLREDERARLEPLPAKAQVVWVWIAGTFQRLSEAGKLPSRLLTTLYETCARARGAVGGVFVHLDTQLPYSYMHLISVVVHVNNLLVATKCGTVAAAAMRHLHKHGAAAAAAAALATAKGNATAGLTTPPPVDSSRTENLQVLLLQAMHVFFVPLITVGLLEVGVLVTEPFGTGFQDFPRSAYHVWLRDECEAFQTAAEEAPRELARVADVVESESKEPFIVRDCVSVV